MKNLKILAYTSTGKEDIPEYDENLSTFLQNINAYDLPIGIEVCAKYLKIYTLKKVTIDQVNILIRYWFERRL